MKIPSGKIPIRLDRALADHKIAGEYFNVRKVFLESVKKNEKLASKEVVSIVGQGSCAIAFLTSDEKVLKLTDGNHFPLNRPRESFDVPIYEQGKAGKIRYYLEERLMQHSLSDGFVSIMQDYIKEKGYRTYDLGDYDIHQIGLSSDGKLYLLDPECAQYKTVFHAGYKKIKNVVSKIFKGNKKASLK